MAAVQPPPRAAMPSATSFLQLVLELLQELPGIVSDRVQLLTLELRRARQALGQMLALGIVAALLALTAWFAFWIGLAAVAMHAGLAWGWMLVLVLALNIGGAWAAVARLRRLAGLLALPATVRRLTVAPPAVVPMPERVARGPVAAEQARAERTPDGPRSSH